MLKFLTIINRLFICTITFASALSKSAHTKNHQRPHEHFTREEDMSEMEPLPTRFHAFKNQTSLKMLEDITAKVWRILPVIDVPRNWVLIYCMKNTEINEQVEKATMQCQHNGTDWDCTFIELGGGQDDFNMGKIVSTFNSISNQNLRSKLLRAAEICSKLWRRYARAQDRRLTRMRLNVHTGNRKKRSSRRNEILRNSRMNKRSKRKKDNHREEMKKVRRAIKEIKAIRRRLANKIAELENKQSLNSEEAAEVDRLRLTTTKPGSVIEHPLIEERAELSRLEEIGSCLSRQTAKACESVVLNAIQELI